MTIMQQQLALLILLLASSTSNAFMSDTISFAIDIQGCNVIKPYKPTLGDIAKYTDYWTGTQKYGAAWALNVCTYGSPDFALEPASSHPVFPQVVTMPCIGTSVVSKMSYNLDTTCGLMEMYAAQEAAAAQYTQATGKSLTAQRRILLNLPDENCQFYGAGSPQCQEPYCYVWITTMRSFFWITRGVANAWVSNPDGIPVMSTVLHELGHTISLKHAAITKSVKNKDGTPASNVFWAYGDCSCMMGCARDAGTCYNALQARQLGYAKPVKDVDDVDMPVNTWVTFQIPTFSTSATNHLTIRSVEMVADHQVQNVFTQAITTTTAPIIVFLSARSSTAASNGADSHIDYRFDKALSIHFTKKVTIDDYEKSIVASLLGVNGKFILSPSLDTMDDYENTATLTFNRMVTYYISIKLVSLSDADGAVVAICRFTPPVDTICHEGFAEEPITAPIHHGGILDNDSLTNDRFFGGRRGAGIGFSTLEL